MIGLYAGLRREEILGLQWDCVFLDTDAPYLSVKRAWHTESNRPVIETELKTKSAKRDIPIPQPLAQCLRAEKEKSNSQFVISNKDGGPLTYSQYKGLWRYVVVRSTKERTYSRYINGKLVKKTIQPVLGETAAHNGKVKYTLDFTVTPHQLRHTYITNLIYAGVDPKTVQYLAGHKHSKITMDIYAKVKYNRPTELLSIVSDALSESYSSVYGFKWEIMLNFDDVSFPNGDHSGGYMLHLQNFFGDLSISFDGEQTWYSVSNQEQWLKDIIEIVLQE